MTDAPLAFRPHDHSRCVAHALAEADALCSRAGVRLFWRLPAQVEQAECEQPVPVRARPQETWATVLLLAFGVAMTAFAAPLMRYTDATGQQLLDAAGYTDQLRAAPSVLRAP